MDAGAGDGAGAEEPARSTGWVARRLGVASSTLRTWQRRYDVGPSGRSAGGHGRYRSQDLDRLERMHRLILAGVPTAEAARASLDPRASSLPGSRRSRRGAPAGARAPRRRRDVGEPALTRAATRLDQPAVESLLAEALDRDGVVGTWEELVVPVLTDIGERHARRGGHIEVEHLFSGCVRTALAGRIGTRRSWDGYPPVLAACPDQEQHSLTLHALGAALAEIGCPTRILGASVPTAALAAATRQIAPRAVFLWAQSPDTARLEGLPALRRRAIPIVVGGPGWRDEDLVSPVMRVDSLSAAVAAVSGQSSRRLA